MQNEKMQEITDIYYTNIRECINLDEQIFNESRLELVKKLYELEDKDNTEVDGALMEKNFIYGITDVFGGTKDRTREWFYDIDLYSIEEWLKTNKKYYLIFFYPEFVMDVEENPEKYEILYKNETGALLQRIDLVTK